MTSSYSLLACAKSHPIAVRPYQGLFNYRSLASLVAHRDVALDVMVPVPNAPPLGPYSSFSAVPAVDDWHHYETHHPRFLYPLPKRLFKYTVAAKTFTRSVSKYAQQFDLPDIVHAGHIFFDGYGMVEFCRERSLPLTVMGRGYILNNYTDLSVAARSKVDETLEYCSGVFCVSDALANIAEKLTNPDKVSVLPNGADPSRYPTDNADSIRSEINIPEENTVVLFVGSFTRRKGIDEIMDVLSTLDLPDVTFVFIGHHGDRRWDLQRAAAEASVDARVYWQLSPLALRRLYAVADLLLLPSYAEGRPNVIYEAMASDTAVLASDIDGIREQVVDGTTGTLIPPGDKTALKQCLTELTADPSRLAAMKHAGRDRLIEQGWSWESHAETLADRHESIFQTWSGTRNS